MLKELKFNIRYLFLRKEFYFAILTIFIVNILHVFVTIKTLNGQYVFIENSYSAEYLTILYNPIITFNIIIIILFPIICSTVLADSNFTEDKRKTTVLLFNRINIKKNIISRIILSFILSFLICFLGFIFNYLMFSILFKHGNIISYFQSLPFDLTGDNRFLLDNLRMNNLYLFIIAIHVLESLILGTLTIFSYSLSFITKQKIVIYFGPLLYLFLSLLFLSLFKLKSNALINMMQPFSHYTIFDILLSCLFLFIISICIIKFKIRNRDIII